MSLTERGRQRLEGDLSGRSEFYGGAVFTLAITRCQLSASLPSHLTKPFDHQLTIFRDSSILRQHLYIKLLPRRGVETCAYCHHLHRQLPHAYTASWLLPLPSHFLRTIALPNALPTCDGSRPQRELTKLIAYRELSYPFALLRNDHWRGYAPVKGAH